MISFSVLGNPISKPRMTQRDKWAKRPCVLQYWAWAQACWEAVAKEKIPEALEESMVNGMAIPTIVSITAVFGFPASYSKSKRLMLAGQPHLLKPDVDNIEKAVIDALFRKGDSHVWATHASKVWDNPALGNQGPRVDVRIETGGQEGIT
tara:strand:+ start:117 stop:566 length:450 start_codon:yes stop_codon:yes gene_type:complete